MKTSIRCGSKSRLARASAQNVGGLIAPRGFESRSLRQEKCMKINELRGVGKSLPRIRSRTREYRSRAGLQEGRCRDLKCFLAEVTERAVHDQRDQSNIAGDVALRTVDPIHARSEWPAAPIAPCGRVERYAGEFARGGAVHYGKELIRCQEGKPTCLARAFLGRDVHGLRPRWRQTPNRMFEASALAGLRCGGWPRRRLRANPAGAAWGGMRQTQRPHAVSPTSSAPHHDPCQERHPSPPSLACRRSRTPTRGHRCRSWCACAILGCSVVLGMRTF